jgi:hypothetical protein
MVLFTNIYPVATGVKLTQRQIRVANHRYFWNVSRKPQSAELAFASPASSPLMVMVLAHKQQHRQAVSLIIIVSVAVIVLVAVMVTIVIAIVSTQSITVPTAVILVRQ